MLTDSDIERSITTPHKLPWFQPMQSLRIILTPTERRRPWILYLTPGLMAAEVAHVAVIVLFLGPIRKLLLPGLSKPVPSDISFVRFAIYFIILCLGVAVLTPLEVIATRLAIQRNHASREYNSVSQEVEGDAEDVAEYSGTEEDVIGYVLSICFLVRSVYLTTYLRLRQENDPYSGLVDCAKSIIAEEGWTTLYRAWWATLLGGLGSAFA